jgi:hypothetical protein
MKVDVLENRSQLCGEQKSLLSLPGAEPPIFMAMLKWPVKEWGFRTLTEFMWLKIGSIEGYLWTRCGAEGWIKGKDLLTTGLLATSHCTLCDSLWVLISKPGVANEVALERFTGHWEDLCVRANVRTFKRRIYFCKNIPWIMLVT